MKLLSNPPSYISLTVVTLLWIFGATTVRSLPAGESVTATHSIDRYTNRFVGDDMEMGRSELTIDNYINKSIARSIGEPQTITGNQGDFSDLEEFLNDFLTRKMQEDHVPGLVFTVVKDGNILFSKGYGYADLEKKIPYDPEKTIFWAASVAKAFTATGVLQLYDRGQIDLYDDVNGYLKDFQVPLKYAEPLTFAHLLTHTDGFEARIGGDAARSAAEIRALREVVQSTMPTQISKPGQLLTYGNFATNLSGVLIEDISGQSFSGYMDQNIFQPLDMKDTTFQQILPQDWIPRLAIGYRYNGKTYEPQPYTYVNLLPGGGMRTTAADMANFMIALLQGGRYKNTNILSSSTTNLLFEQQFRSDPRLAGITYGLFEILYKNQRLLVRDGDGIGFKSRVVFLPAKNVAFFVNYNNEDADLLREEVTREFLNYYFPDVTEPILPTRTGSLQSAKQYEGVYSSMQWDQSTFAKIALVFGYGLNVDANEDGSLTIVPVGGGDLYGGFTGKTRWVEVEPMFFTQLDGHGYLAFGKNSQGQIAYLYSGQGYHGVYSKLAWYQTPGLHIFILIGSTLCFILTTIILATGAWRKRFRNDTNNAMPAGLDTLARWLAISVCVLYIIFTIGVTLIVADPLQLAYGIPPLLPISLTLALVATLLTGGLIIISVLLWYRRYGSFWRRFFYTLLTAVAVVFVWWLAHWNMLGYRF